MSSGCGKLAGCLLTINIEKVAQERSAEPTQKVHDSQKEDTSLDDSILLRSFISSFHSSSPSSPTRNYPLALVKHNKHGHASTCPNFSTYKYVPSSPGPHPSTIPISIPVIPLSLFVSLQHSSSSSYILSLSPFLLSSLSCLPLSLTSPNPSCTLLMPLPPSPSRSQSQSTL